jgi:hypothetical protein
MTTELTDIAIVEIAPSATGKTKRWDVHSRHGGALLGRIAWFGRWRKYAFYPWPETVFEEVCMRELSEFIVNATKSQRERNV